MFEDASGKSKTSLPTYNAIVYAKTLSLLIQQQENHIFSKSSNYELTSLMQTRSGQIS